MSIANSLLKFHAETRRIFGSGLGIHRGFLIIACVLLMIMESMSLFEVSLKRELRDVFTTPYLQHRDIVPAGQPVTIASPESLGANRLRFSCEFQVEDFSGNSNIFQTSDFNNGVRCELSESTASCVITDSMKAPALRAYTLANTLRAGVWYHLTVDALQSDYLSMRIDGYPGVTTWRVGAPYFLLDRVRFGNGFNAERNFHGTIRDLDVAYYHSRRKTTADLIFEAAKFMLFMGFVSFLFFSLPAINSMPPSEAGIEGPLPSYDPLLTLRFIACMMVLFGHGFLINFRSVDCGRMLRFHGGCIRIDP